MASFNPPAGNDPNGSFQAMYARLQAARAAQDENSEAAQDPYSRFNYNQANTPQGYYGQSAADSPVPGLDDFPPPAPSPPSSFAHSHHPPGIAANLAPIGTMPSNAATKADQSTNLLNLLKFGGGGGGGGGNQSQNPQPNPQSSPSASGYTQASSFDHSPRVTQTINQPPIHAPVPMPADPQGLLATLMKGPMQNEASGPRAEPQPNAHRDPAAWNAGPPPMDTQAYLLNLLHRPKPAQNDQPGANEPPQATTLTPQSATGSAVDHAREYSFKQALAENNSLENTPLSLKFSTHEHAESPTAKLEYHSSTSQISQHDSLRRATRFDYNSPFDEFATTAPHSKASKSSTPGNAAPVSQMPTELPAATSFKIMKKTPSTTSSPGLLAEQKRFVHQRSPITSPEHTLRKADGSPFGSEPIRDFSPNTAGAPANGAHNKETVSEALSGLAEKADLEAQEAIARAEQEEVRARIGADLETMMRARTDAEFQEAAQVAARDIKNELDKEENSGALENEYPPEVAQTIRDIVEDAAHGPVADSWESAEAEEIVVIEETPNPIKVYNFPMKPWISITMQDTDEPRPQFRDEVILDIARLKKEFDQIDRNLVAATEFCMVYGMSKAGGLRVIRQEDGKDAKLFTDTKDRIFNVAVSSTPPDANTTLKESIIGTGISGTVYYVQIKSGDKDHLDDAHPEQYGFALPPIGTQEGDAPGGVLKTRARTSSAHPDYFAVGRGKTISIVWPSYVMQKNVFKPGHDRVVDTEKLSRECALRINTGKAGKDFTFSQDDTTIVSLDKSGRVKFWDVRDLTAADETSDPRFPMPAHTSLEVKEPLMTLNTTPEGEKAWPTSVLLLDKQRPYQKRCALRYMIVGMKQNHTLQLWDLALGKPVQEFNLPHTKESDAVCSVTYHPPTGMIVVGHPTRNSIYFLHLSAPKYTIKGLSQVDYIQKLVAKDSSIPEPDSTAVISGVREYSFANKGVLRSLDILVNPTTSSEGDEQTLFELYAMHSKGVTALWIKQNELGWTKDNKVIQGVDATDVGLVKISKLKELPSALASEPPVPEESALPIRIATRPSASAKEASSVPATTLPSGSEQQSRKGIENVHLHERKEADVPVTPINQLDKSEKKGRKRREKAAAAAEKLAAENNQSNGNSHSTKAPAPSAQPTMSVESIQSAVKQISSGLSEKLSSVISSEFRQYQGKVETEFRKSGEAFSQSQKDLLALVSSVLNDNVQTVLSRIISDQFEANVVPQMNAVITKTIENQIDSKVGGKVSHSVQNQMQKSLPNAVFQALQRSELPKVISDKLVEGVTMDMEEAFRETLVNTITPIFSDMAVKASRSVVQDVQRRTSEQINELEQRHLADTHKIDQLTALVAKLSDTVNTMASNQAQLQDGLIKIQQQLAREQVATIQPPPTQGLSYDSPSATSANQLVPYPANSNLGGRDPELQHHINSIASLMSQGDYEGGLVRWIQLSRKHEVFDEYLVKFNPQFMQDMPALVALSVASVIAEQLEGPLLREKVLWIEIILRSLQTSLPHITVCNHPTTIFEWTLTNTSQDAQVRDVVPNIMTNFISRIEKLFMQISNRSPTDPILQHLSGMTQMANRIRDFTRKTSY
ncbi:hypothetical protein F4775DRAFT_330154 [Biscogniauxia sp. FL1348]|nr:hypothetical protein F4775DRAFT_330154 [Biscogniauxia sp. FL1348]